MEISARTKWVALLGKPLGFSKSPAMQKHAFAAAGVDAVYLPAECEEDQLAAILSAARCLPFLGLAVTKPYKVKILSYLDAVDPAAMQIGSCNTVKLESGRLIGYNTDGIGFADALAEQTALAGKTMLILGAGGTARALSFACASRGMARILVANRTAQKAQTLAYDLSAGTSVQAEALSFDSDTLGRAMDCVDILVNATGIGMQPHEGQSPIAANCLLPRVLVCDLAYNPPATRLLLDAEQIGCRIMNGLKMAVYQGVRQFEILTDRRAPFEEMLQVMKRALP